MEQQAMMLESSSLRTFDGLHQHNTTLKNLKPERLEVFTMTFTGHTTAANLLGPGNRLGDSLVGKGGFERRPPNKRRRPARAFENQVTLQFKGEGGFKKAVKIFNNGRIHVAGCKSAAEFASVSRAVCTQLTAVTGTEVYASDMDIVMANINLYCQAGLNLATLRNLMVPRMGTGGLVSVDYTPDRFPGLICKVKSIDKVISILVYGGGCIRMCGLKSFEQAEIPYKFLTSFLDDHLHLIRV